MATGKHLTLTLTLTVRLLFSLSEKAVILDLKGGKGRGSNRGGQDRNVLI